VNIKGRGHFKDLGFVFSVPGTGLRVLPSVVNDLLKEAEHIFKEHGDCEQW
jgi:hypothetical protein